MDSKMQEHSKTRRRHSSAFKSEVVNACRAPGASVASIALAYGVNANLVRQWLRGRGFKQGLAISPVLATPASAIAAAPQFVPVTLAPTTPTHQSEPASSGADIRIEVRRGTSLVTVNWPQAAAVQCAAWLREWLR